MNKETHFGKYRILEKLGQGAQAATYLCEAPDRTKVTLKRIELGGADPWGYAEVFDREVAVLRELDHSYLPKYIDSFCHLEGDAPACHIVWEYIEGKSLEDCLNEGRLFSCDEILDFSLRLCDILEYLSQRNILHRDIKTSNLILSPYGELFLIDFGIAKMRVDFESGSTVAGTFGYMAPEQFMGKSVPKSDIYAATVTMIRLICNIDPQKLRSDLLRIPFENYLPKNFSETGKLLLQCLSDPKVETRCDDFALIRRTLNAIRMNKRDVNGVLRGINHNLPPAESSVTDFSQVLVKDALLGDPPVPAHRGGTSAAIAMALPFIVVGILSVLSMFIDDEIWIRFPWIQWIGMIAVMLCFSGSIFYILYKSHHK